MVKDDLREGYIPANMPGGPTMMNSLFNNKIIGWWNDDCMMRKSKILVSAYHAISAEKRKCPMESFKIPKDVLLFGDSGGFTSSTIGEIDLQPVQVMEWQEKYCDVGLSLDVPPYNLTDETKSPILNDEKFNYCLNKSYDNTVKMIEVRKNKDMLFYICIHGDSFKRLETWFEKHKDLQCDGYALAPKDKGDYWNLAKTLLWIYHKGVRKNVHLLAFSGTRTMPILAYMTKYIKNLTYDSSTWAGGAMRKEFNLPYLKVKVIISDRTNYDFANPLCDCVICQQCKMDDFQNIKYGGSLMSLHNLIMFDNLDKILRGIRNDDELFFEFIRKEFNEELVEVIQYINYGIAEGFDKANEKYKHKFPEENPRAEDKSLFSF